MMSSWPSFVETFVQIALLPTFSFFLILKSPKGVVRSPLARNLEIMRAALTSCHITGSHVFEFAMMFGQFWS